jgi:hypothetical protein
MIRFKKIKEVYPNGLTFVDYYLEDIYSEEWYPAILDLIDLIKIDSREGWRSIFEDFTFKLKKSVFFPVMSSFEDWNEGYSIKSNIMNFFSTATCNI